MTLPIANGHPRSAGMTLPIANGLAGSAGHALPEDAVCDWKVATKATFAIGRGRLKARLRLGRDSRPTRECPYSRYENALAVIFPGIGHPQRVASYSSQ